MVTRNLSMILKAGGFVCNVFDFEVAPRMLTALSMTEARSPICRDHSRSDNHQRPYERVPGREKPVEVPRRLLPEALDQEYLIRCTSCKVCMVLLVQGNEDWVFACLFGLRVWGYLLQYQAA